jgi:hypothetical protein
MPLGRLADLHCFLHCAHDLCALADRRAQHAKSFAYRSLVLCLRYAFTPESRVCLGRRTSLRDVP